MHCIQQSISVGFRYPVHFTQGVFDAGNTLLADQLRESGIRHAQRILFVVDEGLVAHYPGLCDAIQKYCERHGISPHVGGMPLIISGGEVAKNDPAHLQRIYQAIHERRICRHSLVVAIGGGAVLDVVGYAAATAHRGIRLIRIPTTVLAQNDSGVGVKTGINAFGKKNFIGVFAPPHAVINDWQWLATLDDRDWIAGISEAVKVGLIKDAAFFSWIEEYAACLLKRDMRAMQHLIHRCAELHCQHISSSGDPFELGSARPLDFGHWAAHKLEQMTNFELRHGEAVSIGIALDVMYSMLIGSISEDEAKRVCSCLTQLHLPVKHEMMRHADALLEGLAEFREHLGGQLTVTLLRTIGAGYEVHEINSETMKEAMHRVLGTL